MKHITSQNKLHYIDALRGYAIIGVLLAHTIQFSFFNLPNGLRKIIEAGAFGVQLFFVTSAFTLFFSFHKRSKKELFSSLNFFIRRFFRIAPMFYIGVAYYLFQDGFGPRFWLGDETKVTLANVFSNLLFFNGLNPYWINSIVPGSWSIAAEVIFYAILPFLFLRIKNLNQAFNFLILSLLLNGLFHFILNNIHLIGSDRLWSDYLVFYFPNQLPIFALGIVMYFIVRGKDGWNTISNKSILVFGGLLLLQFSTGIPVVF
jgi:peptidoglycan/LPS O-acetylase OafA/YrhL